MIWIAGIYYGIGIALVGYATGKDLADDICKAQDKDHVQIWDVTGNCKFAKRHLNKRKQFYKEANYPFTIEKVNYKSRVRLDSRRYSQNLLITRCVSRSFPVTDFHISKSCRSEAFGFLATMPRNISNSS